MINTSVSKNEHTIQSGVVDYPIGFPFYFNPDRTPQLLVKIGDEELRFNHNFELSEDKGSVVLRPTEEESWTLEGPEDFSWMTKWDGKDLLIERAVPFVQDSDYQLGRISSEQIERDFDLSVMRDQTLQERITVNDEDIEELFKITDKHRVDIDRAQESADDAIVRTVAVEKRVAQAEKDIKSNDGDISTLFSQQAVQDGRLSELESGKIDKDQGTNNVGKVLTVGGDGMVVPKASHGGSGIGVVAHDDSLIGAGTDEYPLGVKDKVTITIVEH